MCSSVVDAILKCWENTSKNWSDFCKSSGQMLCGSSVFCVIIATGLVTGHCVNVYKKPEDFLNVYKW